MSRLAGLLFCWTLICSSMGIKFNCPQGHKLHVKSFLAGKRGICPHCNARFQIPFESGGAAQALAPKRGEVQGGVVAGAIASQPATDVGHVQGHEMSPANGAAIAHPASNGAAMPASPSAHTQAPYPAAAVASPVAAPSDPLADVPHALWYVRPRSGGQFGPAAADVMRQWMGEGRIAADTLLWREGWADWREASTVFTHLASGPSFAYPAATSAPSAPAPLGDLLGAPAERAERPVAVRRKSNGLTLLLVFLLVLMAIALAVVFVWVISQQNAAPSPGAQQATPVAFHIALGSATPRPAAYGLPGAGL